MATGWKNGKAPDSKSMETEAAGKGRFEPWLTAHAGPRGWRAVTGAAEQLTLGDYAMAFPYPAGDVYVELKTEGKWTGNVFVEQWSKAGAGDPSWLWTCGAHLMAFQYLDAGRLVVAPWQPMRAWLHPDPSFVLACPERNPVRKYKLVMVRREGGSVSTGWPVPVADVAGRVPGTRGFEWDGEGWREVPLSWSV